MNDFVLEKLRKTSAIQLEMVREIEKEIEDTRRRLMLLGVQRDKYLSAFCETSRYINELLKEMGSIE